MNEKENISECQPVAENLDKQELTTSHPQLILISHIQLQNAPVGMLALIRDCLNEKIPFVLLLRCVFQMYTKKSILLSVDER